MRRGSAAVLSARRLGQGGIRAVNPVEERSGWGGRSRTSEDAYAIARLPDGRVGFAGVGGGFPVQPPGSFSDDVRAARLPLAQAAPRSLPAAHKTPLAEGARLPCAKREWSSRDCSACIEGRLSCRVQSQLRCGPRRDGPDRLRDDRHARARRPRRPQHRAGGHHGYRDPAVRDLAHPSQRGRRCCRVCAQRPILPVSARRSQYRIGTATRIKTMITAAVKVDMP